jgi:P-type E1-E2 ATPase
MNEFFKYEFTIKGMKCSNCSNHLEEELLKISDIISTNINFITEKALITFKSIETIEIIKEVVAQIGYTILRINDLDTIKQNRIMKLKILDGKIPEINIIGVINLKAEAEIIQIEYDPSIIKGNQLFNQLKDKFNIDYINDFIDNINNLNNVNDNDKINILLCLLLTSLLIIFTMIIPNNLIMIMMDIYIYNSRFCLYIIIVLFLSSFIIYKYGLSIFKKSIRAYIKSKMVNMETLITIGSVSAIALTILNLFKLCTCEDKYISENIMMSIHSLEAAATVISILIIGKYIEDRAKDNIRKQSIKTFPDDKLKKGVKIKLINPKNKKFDLLSFSIVDVGMIEKDDLCEIEENDLILVDSVIMYGEIEVNENITFGELSNTIKSKGDKLKSGSEIKKIKSDKCIIMIEEVLEESLIFKITKEMSISINQKLKLQHFIDSIVKYFVPIIIIISIITTIIWSLIKSFINDEITISFVLEKGISILVVSCPCAFGLAIPTVTTISLNKALKHGILIKNISILPEIRKTQNFVFDKTGTLTEVKKDVNIEYSNFEDYPVYDIILKMEKSQKHPIAQILYTFALKNQISNDSKIIVYDIESYSNGIKADVSVNDQLEKIYIGNSSFINHINKDSNITSINEDLVKRLLNVIYVCRSDRIILILSIDSTSDIRKEAFNLKNLQGKKYILSGDNQESVSEIGNILGFEQNKCIGLADCNKKKEILKNIKSNGTVLMIGDGLNDILSLTEADFGISFNTNYHLNVIASDIIFLRQDLNLISALLKLSYYTNLFIWINIFWAFAYNICMLPIAGGLFHIYQIEMSPTFSSLSMFCSSLLIILTSNLIRLIRIEDNFMK